MSYVGIVILIWIVVITALGCWARLKLNPLEKEQDKEAPTYSKVDFDIVSRAVLEVIYPQFVGVRLSMVNPSLQEIGKAEARIEEVREWASHIPDTQVRTAYLRWMDYYQDEAFRAREKISRGDVEINAYAEEQRRKDLQVAEYVAKNPVPVPPMHRVPNDPWGRDIPYKD